LKVIRSVVRFLTPIRNARMSQDKLVRQFRPITSAIRFLIPKKSVAMKPITAMNSTPVPKPFTTTKKWRKKSLPW
jgi:hypothetical protein